MLHQHVCWHIQKHAPSFKGTVNVADKRWHGLRYLYPVCETMLTRLLLDVHIAINRGKGESLIVS